MALRLKLTLFIGGSISVGLILIPFLFPLTGASKPDLIAAFGRFHMVVLHLPIGILLLIPMLELLGGIRGLSYLKQATPVILALAIFMATFACVLGYMLAYGEGDTGALLVNHMWGGIITTILMICAFLFKQFSLHSNGRLWNRMHYTVLAGSIFSLTIGAHDGASLVHGPNYLSAKFPPAIQQWFTAGSGPSKPVTLNSPAYAVLIKPIFEDSCILCHSINKQKGDFRVDDFDAMLLGGESGMAGIEPGSLKDSEIHYRITLDPSKKGFMPPEGNTPLSEQEVAVITWWIKNGASPTASIHELAGVNCPDLVKAAIDERMTPEHP